MLLAAMPASFSAGQARAFPALRIASANREQPKTTATTVGRLDLAPAHWPPNDVSTAASAQRLASRLARASRPGIRNRLARCARAGGQHLLLACRIAHRAPRLGRPRARVASPRAGPQGEATFP